MSYGSRKRGHGQGGCVRGEVDLPRLRRVTSSPSQTLRRRLVRTTDDGRRGVLDARRRPSRLYFLHFATRTVDHTVDLYAAKPDIHPESRFLPTPFAFDAHIRGFPSECRHPVWYGTRGQSNLTKSASWGPIPRLGVIPGIESCTIEFLG